MTCEECRTSMIVRSTFRFDHEATDTPKIHDQLERFKAMGIELGAAVTVWQCPNCRNITAVFDDAKTLDGL